jgi:hypothetical protein
MIQIHFYLPRTLFEKCVSFFGRTKYCHVAIQYGHVVVESTAGKGVIRRIKYQSEDSDLVYLMSSPSIDELDAWTIRQIGQRYGYLDNGQSVLKGWFHFRLGGNPSGPTCVELACRLITEKCRYLMVYEVGMTPDELIDCLGKIS